MSNEPGSERNVDVMEQQATIIGRDDIIARLGGRGYRLALIRASAGYGKTTLLAQWAETERGWGHRVASITIESQDDHSDQFFMKLMLALDREEGVEVASTQASVGEQTILGLCERLAASPHDWLLLFDDFHLAASPRIGELMMILLRKMPANVRVGIAGRSVPPLPLAAMLAAGQVLEIEADDLRLDALDLRQMFGGRLSMADIDMLVAKTEGWPIALQMARVLTEQSKDPAAFVRQLGGSEQNISVYLASEVLNTLSDECRKFLVLTSCLDAICEELADHLREKDDSWRYLQELDSIRAFFVPFREEGRTWFRHHLMFGEFLARLLMHEPPMARRTLHRRAAMWHAENGLLTQAIAHACKAEDAQLADAILSEAGGAMVGLRQGMLILRRILAMMPQAWIFASPGLLLARSVLLAKEGRFLDARSCVEEAQRAIPADAPVGLQRNLLFADMLTRTYLDAETRSEDLIRAESLLQEVPLSDHWFRGWINNVLCMLHFRHGNLTTSHSFGMAAMANYRDAGAVYTQFFVHLHLGLALATKGAFGAAHDAYRSALRIARQHFPADLSMRAIARILIAELLWERNHVDAAERLLDQSLPFLETYEGWTEIYATGYLTAAALAYNRRGITAALQILDRADEIAEGRRLVRVQWMVGTQRVELLARAGHVSAARESADRLGMTSFLAGGELPAEAVMTWNERQGAQLAGAHLALREGRPDDAVARLAAPLLGCQAGMRPGFELRSLLMLALAQHERGNDQDALTTFARLLTHPLAHHYPRVLLDEPVGVQQLQESCEKQARAGDSVARKCLDILARHRFLAATPSAPAGLNLTTREKQMLLQISRGRTNKMIARDFRLTERTIKFHLQNLYSKLGAANRMEATHLARQVGLAD